MTWLVWRQHRHQAWFAAAALAAFAVLLLVTGLHMAAQYHAALAACSAAHDCAGLGSALELGSPPAISLVELTMAVPCLLGVFWAAPLVAREFETGTGQFAWMQGVTRLRWLSVKTAWIMLAAAVWGGAVAALVTWWSSPLNALKQQSFRPGQFDIQGIVPVGYALFAVALGIAAGTVLRRTVPALAVTFGGFAATRFVIAYFVRPHFKAPVRLLSRPGSVPAAASGSDWQLDGGLIGPHGHIYRSSTLGRFFGSTRARMPGICRTPGAGPGQAPHAILSCLSARGYRSFVVFQPAGRYWPFQGIETAIYLLLAASLITVAAFVLQHRDA